MPKIFALISLLSLVSCLGDSPVSNDVQGGEVRRYEQRPISSEDNKRIQAICTALSHKEDVLDVLLNNQFIFDFDEKNCDGVSTPRTSVVTTLQRVGSEYIFEKDDGQVFDFSSVETSKVGTMVEICKNIVDQYGRIRTLRSPMMISQTGAIWFSTFGTRFCQSDGNNICISIERGSVLGENNYRVHTREWIKFRVNGNRRGFFTERTLSSFAACSNGKALEKKAVLK